MGIRGLQSFPLTNRGGKYRSTFLIPLSILSVLFQKSTVFGTVVTFLAHLPVLGTFVRNGINIIQKDLKLRRSTFKPWPRNKELFTG